MKPTQIFDVLDLAREARKQGHVFNPLFVGPPGLGKSEICQAWCKQQGIPFIDLRAAYLEAPDMIGFPSIEKVNGRQVTVHNIPEIWPFEGEGLILLEEPNRGTPSVMNTMMQILTDRKVHKYSLPDGWFVAGCINPENEEHDVNSMDAALKNRFEIFHIEYDKKDHVNFMRSKKYDSAIINFVETGTWQYVLPEDVSKADGSQYISSRTFAKLHAALAAGLGKKNKIEKQVYESVLGRNVGMSFFHFRHNEQPVTYSDLINPDTVDMALDKLKKFSDPKNYKSGHVSITIKDIVENKDIDDELLSKVLLTLSADQGPVLINELEFKRKLQPGELQTYMLNKYPDIKKYLKNAIKD